MARVKCSKNCWKNVVKDNLLFILTMIGVVVGFALVFILRPLNPSDDVITWLGLPGELFMRGLYCMVIPLLTSSVVVATSSLELKTNGKMSAISFTFMISVVFIAVIVGTALTLAINPGKIGTGNENEDFKPAHYETQDVIADLLRNLIPNNLVKACIQTIFTSYEFEEIYPTTDGAVLAGNNESATPSGNERSYVVDGNLTATNVTAPPQAGVFAVSSKSLEYGGGTNLLGLLVFSAVFGIAMCKEKEATRTMFQFMSALRLISIKILTFYLWLLPIGTPSLICKSMLKVENLIGVWRSLGLFSADVIIGLCIHEFVTLSAIYFIFTRKNPYIFITRCARAILMSMITKTNAATMPAIFRCCEVNNKINKKITNYVVSMNVAMKSDGSALFIISGALYLSQTANMSMNFGHVITMVIVAWVMGLCLPAVPSASLVSIVTVCSAVGTPTDNIGLLVSMEWLLDSLRTGVNCTSHCMAAGLVDAVMGKEVEEEEKEVEIAVESGKKPAVVNSDDLHANNKEETESFL